MTGDKHRSSRDQRQVKEQRLDQAPRENFSIDDAFGHADAGQVRRMVEEARP
jgi:hypothetical protein